MNKKFLTHFQSCRKFGSLPFLKVSKTSKLAIVISCLALNGFALGFSQTISLNLKNASTKQALNEIRKKSGFQIVYNESLLSKSTKVTIVDSKITLQTALNKALAGQDVTYEVKDKVILLKPISKTSNIEILPGSNKTVQQLAVKGRVVNKEGQPIASATVTEKGTNNRTLTNEQGDFSLTVSGSDAVLEITSIGFSPQTVSASGQNISVTLVEQENQMDEVVVVGYGQQKKVNLTGAVSTVSAKELEARPVQNTGQALQGLVPGLNVQTGGLGGELNQTMNVNIRGAGTIGVGSSSSVLVLIDGMEGDMNALNPNDIENITVLKDAAASSIYGSRAPFGVILITTKSGKAGKTLVNYNNNVRLSKPRGLPTMLDSRTFAYYFNEIKSNDGEQAVFSQEVLDRITAYQKGEITTVSTPAGNGKWEYYGGSNGNTNWFDEIYRDFSPSHEHTLSANGGTEKVQFYSSLNFMDQNGLNKYADDRFKRYSFSNKVSVKLHDKIDLMSNTRFVREDYGKASHMNDLYYHNIARRWPTIPVRDDNGHFSDPSELAQMTEGGRSKLVKDFLYQQLQLAIRPLENWNITGNVNYRITNHNGHNEILRSFGYDKDNNPYPLAVGYNSAGYTSVSEFNRKDEYFSTNLFTDYSLKVADDHNFKFLLGFNSELNKYSTLNGSMSDLISDNVPTLNTATLNPLTSGQYQHWATAGFFGRFNYNYKEKYLFEANGRYDGSSRFPRDLRWNLFPSFSAGWNVANEDFWKWDESVSVFKLRASYGELGNQYTDNWYPFYPTLPFTVNGNTWLLNGQKQNYSSSPGLIASTLTWERISSWNVGFDLQALDNRLGMVFELYQRNTYNMIGPAPELPVILGTGVPRLNNAEMNSKGFELELNWKDNIGNFNYAVRGVLSDDKQTVTEYPNLTGTLDTWYNGRRVGELWGYTTLGIAKTQQEMDAHLSHTKQNFASQWQSGDIMYQDLNADGLISAGANTINEHGDLTIIGNTQPRLRYSLDLNGSYKGFDFRVFFQGVGKRDYMPNGPYFWGANGGMWQSAGFEENLDFFRDENSVMVQNGVLGQNLDSYLPRPYFNTNKNQYTQTRYLQNAAYLRLKNAQVGYSFNSAKLNQIGISKIRLYLSGENLLTFTKMAKVFDPETVGLGGWNDGKTYPFSTVYSFGLNVNF